MNGWPGRTTWTDGRTDECPCTIDYKNSLRDRQGENGKVMQTNGNVITFISTVARSASSKIKRRELRRVEKNA